MAYWLTSRPCVQGFSGFRTTLTIQWVNSHPRNKIFVKNATGVNRKQIKIWKNWGNLQRKIAWPHGAYKVFLVNFYQTQLFVGYYFLIKSYSLVLNLLECYYILYLLWVCVLNNNGSTPIIQRHQRLSNHVRWFFPESSLDCFQTQQLRLLRQTIAKSIVIKWWEVLQGQVKKIFVQNVEPIRDS